MSCRVASTASGIRVSSPEVLERRASLVRASSSTVPRRRLTRRTTNRPTSGRHAHAAVDAWSSSKCSSAGGYRVDHQTRRLRTGRVRHDRHGRSIHMVYSQQSRPTGRPAPAPMMRASSTTNMFPPEIQGRFIQGNGCLTAPISSEAISYKVSVRSEGTKQRHPIRWPVNSSTASVMTCCRSRQS